MLQKSKILDNFYKFSTILDRADRHLLQLCMYINTAFSSCFKVVILATIFNPMMDRLYMNLRLLF